jgi:elongation factor Ts
VLKEKIKQLRELTGAGLVECKEILTQMNGDFDKAKDILLSKVNEKANDKSNRNTSEGMIGHYIHQNKKVGSIVIVKCETDFVAKNAIFQQFASDLAMQVAALDPENMDELMNQSFIKNDNILIKDYMNQIITKLGENIVIQTFNRFMI